VSPRFARFVLIPAVLAAAVGIAVALTVLRTPPPKKPIDTRPLLVDVLTLQPERARFDIASQGTVRPLTETVLSAEVAGTVIGMSSAFVAGGLFATGDELLEIDPTNYRVAVERAEALVRQRQVEFDGNEKLRSKGYRAESDYVTSAAALAAAKAELVQAKRDLERTSIRLPFDGMVRSKDVDLGQFVAPGTVLGTVFATDIAEIRLPLTDEDLAFIDLPLATGSRTDEGPEVTLTAMQRGREQQWHARIVRSEGVVDENSRVTYAVARIDDPYRLHTEGTPLPMGTFVSAAIRGQPLDDVYEVPRYALRGSDELLFLDADDTVRIHSVKIVHADAENAYIGEGVQPGERIVLTAIEAPFNGMPVRVSGEDDTAPGLGAADEDLAR
jgi:RND family efflux transporter MFP subunit